MEEMGEAFVARVNQEFIKAGLRGLSLLFATGDRAVQHYKGKYWVRCQKPSTLNPLTLNPNSQPGTRNPEPETILIPKPRTWIKMVSGSRSRDARAQPSCMYSFIGIIILGSRSGLFPV